MDEFDPLSTYGMSFMDTEENKNEKFVSGLREDLGRHLINHMEESFEKPMNISLRHETMYPKSKQLSVVKEEFGSHGKEKRKFLPSIRIRRKEGMARVMRRETNLILLVSSAGKRDI